MASVRQELALRHRRTGGRRWCTTGFSPRCLESQGKQLCSERSTAVTFRRRSAGGSGSWRAAAPIVRSVTTPTNRWPRRRRRNRRWLGRFAPFGEQMERGSGRLSALICCVMHTHVCASVCVCVCVCVCVLVCMCVYRWRASGQPARESLTC